MKNIVKGMVLITFGFSCFAMADKKAELKKQGEKIVKEFVNSIKEVRPRIGNFYFVSCQENFALSSINIGASAKLKESILIPVLGEDGSEQKAVIGGNNTAIDFAVFSGDEPAPLVPYDKIDLKNMKFNCKKQEDVVYKTKVNFSSNGNDYADISYTHPLIDTIKLRIGEVNGEAIKMGDDIYAKVQGLGRLETFDKFSGKTIYQDMEVVMRFHYNNAGDKPILNMDGTHIANQVNEIIAKVPVAVVPESRRVKVVAKNLNLRKGPNTSYDVVGDAAKTFDDDIFNVIARSGKWLNVEVNGKSLWMHGSTKYVQYLD